MIPRVILGANLRMVGPDNDPSIRPVRVRYQNGAYSSAWEPTPEELLALNRGGSVVISVLGCQPPLAVHVEGPHDD